MRGNYYIPAPKRPSVDHRTIPYLVPKMKHFEFEPSQFSKKQFFIGGLNVYVYNSEPLEEYVKSFRGVVSDIPVNVQYLVHQRGGDYSFTESIAYKVLEQYNKKTTTDIPLIAVTFDNRNHGERQVDATKNSSWKSGNTTHGIDMISAIEGNVADLKLITDFLPLYLNLDVHVDRRLKDLHHTEIKYKNWISGYSLGGHTVIRFANKYPHLVEVANPVVGSNDLSSLLITRLLETDPESADYVKKYFYFNYNELPLSDEQKLTQYPEAFHVFLSRQDTEIFENFPMHKIKLFAAFGADDKLVPPRFSQLWVDQYVNTNDDAEVFVQEGVGHDVTPEMIDQYTTWLAKVEV